jgi:hypothetical protein
MSDQAIEELLSRIDAYDGSEEQFATIIDTVLRFVPEKPKLPTVLTEIARRCSVAKSTPGQWSRGSSIPGPHVRTFVLDAIKEILEEHRP